MCKVTGQKNNSEGHSLKLGFMCLLMRMTLVCVFHRNKVRVKQNMLINRV